MTRDEKIAEAQRLRDSGLSYAKIGREFGVSKTTVRRWLNADVAERAREYSRNYQPDRERKRAADNEYSQTLHGRCVHGLSRSRYAARRYGYKPCITSVEVVEAAWTGVCANCGVADSDRRLCLDHDHDTGEFRAWLCQCCNATQRHCFDDDPQRMKAGDTLVGVYWDKSRSNWHARVGVKGEVYNVGRFDDPVSAAYARNKFIIDNGIHAVLNRVPERRTRVRAA